MVPDKSEAGGPAGWGLAHTISVEQPSQLENNARAGAIPSQISNPVHAVFHFSWVSRQKMHLRTNPEPCNIWETLE